VISLWSRDVTPQACLVHAEEAMWWVIVAADFFDGGKGVLYHFLGHHPGVAAHGPL